MSDSMVHDSGKLPPQRVSPDLPESPALSVSAGSYQKSGYGDTLRHRLQKIQSLLFGKAILSIVDQGLVSATSFATSVLIGRLCGQSELGIYALAWSILVFTRGVQDNIISAPYTVFCQKYQRSALHAYTGSTFAHQLIFTAATSTVILMVILLSELLGNTWDVFPVALSLLGALPLVLVREHVRRLSIAHQDLHTTILIDGAVAVAQIGTLLLLGWFGLLTVPIAYGVMAMACAIAFCGVLFSGRYQFRMVRGQWVADWMQNWSFARWALVTFLIGCSASCIMPWIIQLTCGVASTGLFAASMTIMGIGSVVVTGLTNLAVPRAAQALADGGIPRLKKILPATLVMFAMPSLIFCGIAAIGGKAIALFIYGPAFEAAGPIVTALYFWLLANAVGVVAGSSLWAMERPDANLVADFLTIIVMLISALYLVQKMGVSGAAYGMLMGAVIGNIARWVALLGLFRKNNWQRGYLNA